MAMLKSVDRCGEPADGVGQTDLSLLPQAANFEISSSNLILRGNQGQQLVNYAQVVATPH
jgi:hypothetical protein